MMILGVGLLASVCLFVHSTRVSCADSETGAKAFLLFLGELGIPPA
jgi:hypothetical protein